MTSLQSIAVVFDHDQSGMYGSLEVDNTRVVLLSGEKSALAAAILKNGPAIVILDSGADIDKGMTVLGELKVLRRDLPVIFLTDASSEEAVRAAFKRGAQEYFRKPVDPLELKQAIEHILSLSSETRKESHCPPAAVFSADAISEDFASSLPPVIRRVVHHIQTHFSDPIYLDDLARVAHLSKYHFCRCFKQHVGLSPMRFVSLIKIRKAEYLLRRPDVTISTVAYKVGFNDLSEFTRQFKSITGLSPSAYRRSLLH